MNKSNRNLLISIGVVIIVTIGGYVTLITYTGFSSPFSIVMSQSMQHDPHQSKIGSIDTGDLVLIMDPSKTEIYSYIEGIQNGYSSFGDYGSVIIYNRGNDQNPVIHRTIVWLEYNISNDTWSAPSLADYMGIWYCIYYNSDGKIYKQNDYNNLQGTLYFENITIFNKNISINLDTLEKSSGFLTMGDNPKTNRNFDQPSIINHTISYKDIRSVSIMEIPWLGTIKILFNGGNNLEDVPNSLSSFIMLFVTIFGFLFLIDAVMMYKNILNINKKLQQIYQWKH